MRIAALDVGEARIGVAVSDELGITAQGIGVVRRVGGQRDLEALAALTELHAHVIVSDISMPAIDGTELLRRARTLDAARRTRTPAIAFSGFTGKDHQEAAREAGFDVFVGKPADPLDIALHIQSLTQDV